MKRKRLVGLTAAALAATIALPITIGVFSGYESTDGGHVAVIRNAGLFDDHATRQVIQPSSSLTWIGLWSDVHPYPSNERFYTITADASRGDRSGVDYIRVPTIDGVSLEFEGTIYFTLNLDEASLRKFDDKYGTRTFDGKFPWDGDEGWANFLDQIIRPVIDNAFRQEIGQFRCVELISSCIYLQAGQQGGQVDPNAATTAGQQNGVNLGKIQESINTALRADFRVALGGDYLMNVRTNLAKAELPDELQKSVTDAQVAWVDAGKAQAAVQKADSEAAANRKRQEGYNSCPTCAQIDVIKALPPGITTYAPGAGATIPLGTK